MRFSILAFLCFLPSVVSAPIPANPPKPPIYYASSVGTKWVYTCDDKVITNEITSVKEKNGWQVVAVTRDEDGKSFDGWLLKVSPKGIHEVEEVDTSIDDATCWLKPPYEAGQKWTISTAKIKGTATIIGTEKLETPAGTFEAIRVDWDYTLNGEATKRKFWYAPDVGLIKAVSLDRKEVILKSFTPGKK